MSKRNQARLRRIEATGTPALVEAVRANKISIFWAEQIAHLAPEVQHQELLARGVTKRTQPQPPPATSAPAPIKTGKVEKPATEVPAHLLRGLLTPDMVAAGYALYNDVAGQPCSLAPDVSELEHRERAASMIGGSWKERDLINYEKWERFAEKKIAGQVLKVLGQMSPLAIPGGHRHKAFVYNFDLGRSTDLRELATMLSAHLLRMADALELKEKYGGSAIAQVVAAGPGPSDTELLVTPTDVIKDREGACHRRAPDPPGN